MLDCIAPGPDDIVLPKTSSSVFISTNLDYLLRCLGKRQARARKAPALTSSTTRAPAPWYPHMLPCMCASAPSHVWEPRSGGCKSPGMSSIEVCGRWCWRAR